MQNDSSIHHSKYSLILLIWEKLSFCDNNKTLQTVDQILKLKTKKSLNLLNLHMHVNQLKLKYLLSNKFKKNNQTAFIKIALHAENLTIFANSL